MDNYKFGFMYAKINIDSSMYFIGVLQSVATDYNLKVLDKSKPYFFFCSYHDFKINLDVCIDSSIMRI